MLCSLGYNLPHAVTFITALNTSPHSQAVSCSPPHEQYLCTGIVLPLMHVIHINHVARGPRGRTVWVTFMGFVRATGKKAGIAFKQLSAFLVPRGTENTLGSQRGNLETL